MNDTIPGFGQFELPEPLLRAIGDVGYETPSPIQFATIPPLLEGRDVLGHAPTGTGKTAAFALPILARIEPRARHVQALVLTPTRELAIQVSEAITRYAHHLSRMHVLPIYGGQDYGHQIRGLARGVQVVVGTPGRIMDHLRRGTLSLAGLDTLVLDEADEMLRMGFIDDVEWILEQTPESRQTALFSATMPAPIRAIAKRHLRNPAEISIKAEERTAANIRQHFWLVSGMHKLDALTRILDVEHFGGIIVFVRTRHATVELAEKLQARGFAAEALHGDMAQKQREHIVDKLRTGRTDLLVATDVVARGLDVERITHVINYDMPHDVEAYVHRIGRTGRAGREGDAILFVAPRERRLLRAIEKATRNDIRPYEIPSIQRVNDRRIRDFKARITTTLQDDDPDRQRSLELLEQLIGDHVHEQGVPIERVAAALAQLSIGDEPLLLSRQQEKSARDRSKREKSARGRSEREKSAHERRERKKTGQEKPRQERSGRKTPMPDSRGRERPMRDHQGRERSERKMAMPDSQEREKPERDSQGRVKPERDRPTGSNQGKQKRRVERHRNDDPETERYRVEVGSEHGVQAANIVGAIANEAGIDPRFIGRIRIDAEHSTVALPVGMPKPILRDLKRAWVCGRRLAMTRIDASPAGTKQPEPEPPKRRKTTKRNRKHRKVGKKKT
ncbi:MAG: ATP-dependent RNA helicase [Gammaproteobacteria bacterium]|nr:MAG: ATP-dependent RNA helicase [Gammaproteobacteria bacterium]